MKRSGVILAVSCLLSATNGVAQPYPARSIRLVVPFAAGGATYIIAQALGQNMAARLGQNVVVDPRGGAGGVIGTDIVAKAAADGYTLLMATAANAANASLVKNMPHDFERDLRAVTLVVMAPYLLIVNPKVPVNSVSDLVRLAKGSPGKLSYASPGIGSSVHLTGELFQIMAGVNLVHIPYKGAGAALADVVAGRVEMMFSAIPGVIPFIRSGRLKGLAVTSAARSVGLPDVPTIGESGVPGFDMSGWYGLVAPRATPAAIVRALNKSVNEAMAAGEIHAQFVAMGLDPVGGSAEEFSAFIRKELDKYARLVRSANIPLQ